MANYTTLKDAIEQVITTNGNNEITGAILRQTLLSMINSLGANYQFVGIATPATSPGTPDQNVFYLAGPGTYPNFNNAVVNDGQLGVLKFNGSWVAETVIVGKNYDKLIGVYMDNVVTQPGKVYIDSSMVNPGDVLYFELESINNLQGVLRAEKTGYVFDQYISVGAGETATVQYTVPDDFLRIYTASNANPMRVIICRNQYANKTLYEKLPTIVQETGQSQQAVMSQDVVTKYGDSPFAVIVPDALKGIVAFRMVAIPNDPLPVNNYKQFRVSTIYMGGAWNISIQIQASIDGVNWINYDGFDRLATDAPNPLPVIEIIESNTKRFLMVVNWPMMGNISASGVNYLLKKNAPNYLLANLLNQINVLDSGTVKKANITQSAGNSVDKIMSQDAVTKYVQSIFVGTVSSALNGIVAFRMNNVPGNNMPVDDYTQFRISSIYMGGAWNLSMQIQKSTDGVNWSNYDGIDRLATDAPNPLPVIEEITSNYGAFTVIINWPMMGNISGGGVNYVLRKDAPNYFSRKLQEQITDIKTWMLYGDYENKDRTKQVITVDALGNGDYTTIADAYAAITDSSFENQYEVVIYPGTYNEYNLIPPKFTHTHGLKPGTVIVSSVGVSSTLPVFDQRVPCKLSDMTIISGTGYCVHQDQTTLNGIALVNENLYCKKDYGQNVKNFGFRSITNPAILGIGSHIFGAKFVWNNCVFEDGKIGIHTIGGDSTIPGNQHLIFKNCKIVNAFFDLGVAGSSDKVGNFVFEIDGLFTEIGRPSLMCVLGARSSGDSSYNYPWQIIGGQNKNFIVITDNAKDSLTNDVWPNINTDDITFVQLASGVSVSKGQFVDISGNICTGSTIREDIVGIALEDGASGATVRVCTGSFAYNNAFNSASFPVVTNDGNYGIGSDGRLLKDAANIIGRIKYNNFYYV